jgi:hypothetical protein
MAAWFYCHPFGQFRPLRSVGAVPYQTNIAAGISTASDFSPASKAKIPSRISVADAIDVFAFLLIGSLLQVRTALKL